ncbi:MAG: peptidase M1, partial [Eudoraea sp.]
LVGEKNLNKAFRSYADSAAFRPKAPFTTTKEWYHFIKSATPDSLQYYLEDSFEKITLYSNKTSNATYKELDNGKYEVTIDVQSSKSHFDGNGKLLDSPESANLLEIGIFTEDAKNALGMTVKSPLVLEKRWVMPGENSFTYTVEKLPLKAGIDPYNKMIDRIPDDNLIAVEEKLE